MLPRVLLACVIIGTILGGSELLWRAKIIRGEIARKLIHIAAGSFAAFMPFWLSYEWIAVLSVGAIGLSLFNHYHRFFKAGLDVKRRSLGDLLFAVAILICALVQPDKWIFAAAILHVSLADGLAAIVGTYLGHYHGSYYKVLRQQKSVIGSATFLLTSFVILAVAITMGEGFVADTGTLVMLVLLPIFTTLAEGLGVYGMDNLLLPLLVMFALQTLQQ